MDKSFSQAISVFHGMHLPEDGLLVGYSYLIDKYKLKVPLPEKLSMISLHHRRYQSNNWEVFTPRYKPQNNIADQLTFALRYEGVDLAVLYALFKKLKIQEIENWIKREPIGQYSRRIWFLYEWLIEKKLKIPDATSGNFIDILNPEKYFTAFPIPSKRHRVRNNLPGVKAFCPLVRRTPKLKDYIRRDLKALASQTIGRIHPDILGRAAAFMLLKDSRASFAIEGEKAGKNRTERWGKAIGQAGTIPISLKELLRLQQIVIGDSRFVKLGFRKEGGFIGVHDRVTGLPIPDHISAKWQDLPDLLNGLVEANNILKISNIDPVVSAAIVAFGFVFIHPFSDGNGRVQRYLFHHVLAEHNFAPPGLIFPVSAAILHNISEYKKTLEQYSLQRLDCITWKATEGGNLEVTNDTINLYRYFDATKQAEFLYDCVLETIEKILPEEIHYLERYDNIKEAIKSHFDMPDYKIDLLIHFLEQNTGKLSKRALEKEFKGLTKGECTVLEKIYTRSQAK